jgi:hypothetical protein
MEAKDRPPFIPPFAQLPPVADGAELAALRVIVMTLVAVQACEFERLGVSTGRAFVNRVSELCQEALIDANFDSEPLRQRTIAHVNGILGGIGFPPDADETH